jgi:hypothetical protein
MSRAAKARATVLEETLSAGYLLVLAATAEQRVRAEPFDALELAVGDLFGHEP